MHFTSLLDEQPAFWIQVEIHRGRTLGQPASGGGVGGAVTEVVVVVVRPPVDVLGTHLPSLNSSLPLQVGTAEEVVVVCGGLQTPLSIVEPDPHVVVCGGLQTPLSMVEPDPHDVVDVTPPVGLHVPLSKVEPDPQSLVVGRGVEERGSVGTVVAGVVRVVPPVTGTDTQMDLVMSNVLDSPQALVVSGVVVVDPPVTGVDGTQDDLESIVLPSPQRVVVTGG